MDDIICISHLRWDFVWQRPQHLLSRLARQRKVLFVEEPVTVNVEADSDKQIPWLDAVTDRKTPNLTVIRLMVPVEGQPYWIGHGDPRTQEIYTELLQDYLKLSGIDPHKNVLWLYTPMALDFVDSLQPDLLVYDVMDQLAAFKLAPPELLEREETLLKRADLVFTGGPSLYRAKLPFNPRTYYFASGVEVEHFGQATTQQVRPAELAGLTGKPLLGYYGVVDERMDLDLLREVSQTRPDWNFAIIGPVLKIDPADLPQAPNLHYIGMKTYDELPAYLAFFDVALVPFALNEATRYLSPTKTLEYIAAHKPVVSTAMQDVSELYGSVVRIGRSPQEFVQQIEAALQEDPASRLARENKLLAEGTWDSLAQRMNQLIEEQEKFKRA